MQPSTIPASRKIFFLTLVCVTVALALAADSTRLRPIPAITESCLDREIVLARDGASAAEVRRSVDSVTRVIRDRSGIELDATIVDRIADLEERTLRGEVPRISLDDLSAAVATTALERVRDCTDDEISYAADAFSNVTVRAPDAPPIGSDEEIAIFVTKAKHEWRRNGETARAKGTPLTPTAGRSVMLRYSGEGMMSQEEFVDEVKRVRARLRLPRDFIIAESVAARLIRDDFRNRVATFRTLAPAAWSDAPDRGLTPVGALVLLYSAASSDSLTFSTTSLQAQGIAELTESGFSLTSDELSSWRPYGSYGQRFSTPLELAFRERSLSVVFDRLDKRRQL